MRPRLGQINYINSLPIALPIARGLVSLDADVHFGTPQQLNHRYAQKSLDLGVMSAFFFLENNALNLIPHLSISSVGPVGSVLFFCKSELKKSGPLRIEASDASATSVNLLSVLLRDEFNVEPRFSYCPTPDLISADVDGVLVIGDYALAVDGQWSKLGERFDLGEWWTSRFNLPMVFAVWAARFDWQAAHTNECQSIAASLQAALALGLGTAFDQVIAEAGARSGLPAHRLEKYFRQELNFSFSAEHQAGLNRYKSLCEKYGLLGPCLLEGPKQQIPVG